MIFYLETSEILENLAVQSLAVMFTAKIIKGHMQNSSLGGNIG
jgi:hypothetical protein